MQQTRREMLKTSLGASALLSFAPGTPTLWQRAAQAAPSATAKDDTILIVLQLSGGNDGLNTVVPYQDDVYGRSRRTLRLNAKDLHKIGDTGLAFHPRIQDFQRLYDDGHMGILQGVGYPQSSRDHKVALLDWHTAQPGETNPQTGWLGRTVDLVSRQPEIDVPAVFVSPIPTPFALNAAESVVPSLTSLDSFQNTSTASLADSTQGAELSTSTDNPLLSHVQQTAKTASTNSQRFRDVMRGDTTGNSYPQLQLAQSLRTVAQLIRADVGIRIYLTELGGDGFGGFDNHANQRDNHAALLSQLAQSVAAFVYDLKRDGLLDRVLLMTFSEFGRTVSENGRRGTGHGAAAPVFLVGGKVQSGLIGEHPSLADLDQDAPKPHTDFRRVYATALDSWLGIDSVPVLGDRYETLDILKS
jgi:uncharacterized protein (DUF1501 family)